MAWGSIVDYMRANKMDASYGNRSKMAKQYGIKGYAGTANQNLTLLNYLQSGKKATTTTTKKPVTSPTVVKPKISNNDLAWYNAYSKSFTNGVANTKDYARYTGLQSKYGLKGSTISSTALHNLSLKAAGGDKAAQAYLTAMKLKAESGAGLWKGITDAQLNTNSTLQSNYFKDNAYSTYTKNWDMNHYNSYNTAIQGNKPLTDGQLAYYQKILDKWNLQDNRDPYFQQQQTLAKDKQAALDAQDVALNTGLGQMDANSFNQYQQLQQQFANKGMGDSGMAADAYMRATMGNNQNYQQAYTDAAQQKSDIKSTYDEQISNSKISAKNYQDQINQKNAENAIAADKNQNDYDVSLAKVQNDQDKFLTTSTGYVYVGGKLLKDSKGKAVRTLDYYKLSETQRHNLVNETNTATKNQQTYEVNMDKNQVARQKIAADLQSSITKNKLDYAKLDFNYAKLDATNKYNQEKLKLAAANAQTSKDKTQLNALGKQASTLTSQITAYQKKGKKPPKSLVTKYNETMNSISKIVGGTDFQGDTKGSDVSKAPSGTPKAFGGFRRYGQQPKTFNTHMSAAVQKGVPFAQTKLLTELIGRESGFSYKAQNPTSTAYGYGQFLKSTRAAYKKRYPNLDYNNPVDQIVLTWHYVKDRYGTAQKALEAWENHSPHWY